MSARVAVLASGGGTNLQALIDHFSGDGRSVASIALVLSDNPGAVALDRAAKAGIPSRVIPVRERSSAQVAAETLEALHSAGIDLIALAGYLRLVPAEVVGAYRSRTLNVHPALLPAFGGKGMYGRRVHEAVLASGARVSGATVHLVDEVFDRGPIVAQWPVPVLPGDTADTLGARVLVVEHILYPAVVEALAQAIGAGRELPAFRTPGDAFAATSTRPAELHRQVRAALWLT